LEGNNDRKPVPTAVAPPRNNALATGFFTRACASQRAGHAEQGTAWALNYGTPFACKELAGMFDDGTAGKTDHALANQLRLRGEALEARIDKQDERASAARSEEQQRQQQEFELRLAGMQQNLETSNA